MSARVNLLLLLSALLSALTGLGASVRQPQAVQAAAQQAAKAVAAAPHAAAMRPVPALPALVRVAAAPPARVFALVAAEPVFATRRRE